MNSLKKEQTMQEGKPGEAKLKHDQKEKKKGGGRCKKEKKFKPRPWRQCHPGETAPTKKNKGG